MKDEAKNIILTAVEQSYNRLINFKPPATKKIDKSFNIDGLTVSDIQKKIIENNIPDDAVISACSCDDTDVYDACMCWKIEIPTDDIDKSKYRASTLGRLDRYAWHPIYKNLTDAGYNRKGFGGASFRKFNKEDTVYKMYIEKRFSDILEYYELFFNLD